MQFDNVVSPPHPFIRQNMIVGAMGIPGTLAAMAWVHQRWSTRALNIFGFFLFVVVCLAFAIASRAGASPQLRFTLFCILYAVLNFGPNVATFVLPTEVFPTEVRATFFGLAAGCGKVGALIGSGVFGPIQRMAGVDAVYFVCAAVSTLGMLVTWAFVPSQRARPSDSTSPLASEDAHALDAVGEDTDHADESSRSLGLPVRNVNRS